MGVDYLKKKRQISNKDDLKTALDEYIEEKWPGLLVTLTSDQQD